jgi:hypothetical protein
VEVHHHSTRSSRRQLAGTAVAGEGRASGRDPGEAVRIQDHLGEGTDPAGAVGRTLGSPGRLVDHMALGVGRIGADRTLAGPAARKVSMDVRGTSTRGE